MIGSVTAVGTMTYRELVADAQAGGGRQYAFVVFLFPGAERSVDIRCRLGANALHSLLNGPDAVLVAQVLGVVVFHVPDITAFRQEPTLKRFMFFAVV